MPSRKPKPRIGRAKVSRTGQGYFHDLDPYSLHATQKLAQQDRSRLFQLGGGRSRHSRVSTFYTILQDKRKNNPTKFGSVPQGPHTFPHHGIYHALVKARKNNRLDEFHPLIATPKVFRKAVAGEIPEGHQKWSRAELAAKIYQRRYLRYESLRNNTARNEWQDIQFVHSINKLMQLHPFASYSYKSGGASKKSLNNKGERSNKPLASQIDLPAKNGFKDIVSVKSRNNSILGIVTKF